MSDLNQINTALERLFNKEGQRGVFWNDPDREFQSTLPFIMLDSVTTLRLDQVGRSRPGFAWNGKSRTQGSVTTSPTPCAARRMRSKRRSWPNGRNA